MKELNVHMCSSNSNSSALALPCKELWIVDGSRPVTTVINCYLHYIPYVQCTAITIICMWQGQVQSAFAQHVRNTRKGSAQYSITSNLSNSCHWKAVDTRAYAAVHAHLYQMKACLS
jgi:hypothetical protein